jgi:GxxExxY protein
MSCPSCPFVIFVDIVELKALNQISDRERSQLLNYLKASGLRVGVLINFGSVGKLEWQRMVK